MNFPARTLHCLTLLFAVVCGLITSASAEWNEKVLYSFRGGTDGAVPAGGVVFDKSGNLYGVTEDGGGNGCNSPGTCGTVFELSPPAEPGGAWTERVLYVFKGQAYGDGATPEGGVIIDTAGNLYGTTGYGGTGPCTLLGGPVGCGTVYELSPPAKEGDPWTEKVLYSFQGGSDGNVPTGGLVFDKAGNLYGATLFGGGQGTTCDPLYGGNCGTVFESSPPQQPGEDWTEKVLHSFGGGTDGAVPNGGLVLDRQGAVYGTTSIGGNQLCNFGNGNVGCGIGFQLTPPTTQRGAWAERILRFEDGKNGAGPDSIALDSSGELFGAAASGGIYQNGLVFQLIRSTKGIWAEFPLHDFTGSGDGVEPGGLTIGPLGAVYGTSLGGISGRGVVFRLTHPPNESSWTFTLLYNFTGNADGHWPQGGLSFDPAGDLFGTTLGGGSGTSCTNGCGTVFEVSP
jgi:hypothetical protein